MMVNLVGGDLFKNRKRKGQKKAEWNAKLINDVDKAQWAAILLLC
jgi:hypothetical protein